ncbi:hypothetical protein TNCV_594251 [Trichonephila clavipes]|nr:hypothetical protein TNCV_594251 [Trichonephila clavipes]
MMSPRRLATLTAVSLGLGSNPEEDMGACKYIVPLRHGGTLNSRPSASPLVRLVEGEERDNLKESVYRDVLSTQMDLVARLYAACTSVDTTLLRRMQSPITRRAQASHDMHGGHLERLPLQIFVTLLLKYSIHVCDIILCFSYFLVNYGSYR